MKLKKLLPCLLAMAVAPVFADALTAQPKKVGPVSYYGALHTKGNQIIGAKNSQQAMLRGMSMYWSDATGSPFYKKEVIGWAKDELKIDVFRFAMGIEHYKDDTSDKMIDEYSFKGNPDAYYQMIDQMVEAAVENDIYIIIDWHSHRAHLETALAQSFFSTVSKKYANIPNVIYEIYNEPTSISWNQVKQYAEAVVPGIRSNTQNLILVGNPSWSQNPQQGAQNPVSGGNIGYVLHFYAGTHSVGSFSGNINSALNAGAPVFITEWGTTNADGAGSPNQSSTQAWLDFMDQNKISNCNWSLSIERGTENSAMFSGNDFLVTRAQLESASYTASGNIVKNYLTSKARSWADSLVKGKNTGNCAFKATTVKQGEAAPTNILKAGCTYTSSNESAVSVNGSNLTIGAAGFAILTGNDGSQSVLTVQEVEGQTIAGLVDGLACRYGSTSQCINGNIAAVKSYSSTGEGQYYEYIFGGEGVTTQGVTFKVESLNPEIVSVKQATCANAKCYGNNKNARRWMLEFRSYGTAKLRITAPAVTGYRAMDDIIEVSFLKGQQKIHSNFKDLTIALGSTAAGALPSTTIQGGAISYTFNGQPTTQYGSVSGEDFIVGQKNAVIKVTAKAPELPDFDAQEVSRTFIIGSADLAENWDEYNKDGIIPVQKLAVNASFTNNGVMLVVPSAGNYKIALFNANGSRLLSQNLNVRTGVEWIALDKVPVGNYILTVKNGAQSAQFRWNKVK